MTDTNEHGRQQRIVEHYRKATQRLKDAQQAFELELGAQVPGAAVREELTEAHNHAMHCLRRKYEWATKVEEIGGEVL